MDWTDGKTEVVGVNNVLITLIKSVTNFAVKTPFNRRHP